MRGGVNDNYIFGWTIPLKQFNLQLRLNIPAICSICFSCKSVLCKLPLNKLEGQVKPTAFWYTAPSRLWLYKKTWVHIIPNMAYVSVCCCLLTWSCFCGCVVCVVVGSALSRVPRARSMPTEVIIYSIYKTMYVQNRKIWKKTRPKTGSG